MPKKRKYKRDKAGRFGSGGFGVIAKSPKQVKKARAKKRVVGKAKPKKRSQRSIAKQIAQRKPGGKIARNISNKAIRRERNQQALNALRKAGVKIPAGSISKVAQLKKGETVKLADGTILKRSMTNKYTVSKPKKAKKKPPPRR